MKVAYADPPYIGMAKKHYSHDDKCAEVDHVDLIERLSLEYDGWALSMHTRISAMKIIIADAPDDCRLAAWVKPFAAFKKGVSPAYTWEPLLFKPCRKNRQDKPTVKDHVSACITMKKGLVGAKPESFCYWLFSLLGMEIGDHFYDLYPGTGVVTDCWNKWSSTSLPIQAEICFDAADAGVDGG